MTSKKTLFEDRLLREGMSKNIKTTILYNEPSEKKLKIISWTATFFSYLGIIFNAYQMVICWPIWCVANFFWTYWAWKKEEWAQVFLWIIFTIANLYGWYVWVVLF